MDEGLDSKNSRVLCGKPNPMPSSQRKFMEIHSETKPAWSEAGTHKVQLLPLATALVTSFSSPHSRGPGRRSGYWVRRQGREARGSAPPKGAGVGVRLGSQQPEGTNEVSERQAIGCSWSQSQG